MSNGLVTDKFYVSVWNMRFGGVFLTNTWHLHHTETHWTTIVLFQELRKVSKPVKYVYGLNISKKYWLLVHVLSGPVRYPDQEKSPNRGTLSIIETWSQNTNYLKIEHFSRLVAAELGFPQLPDIWAALSLLNIFPSRPLTSFKCMAGTPWQENLDKISLRHGILLNVSNPIVDKDIINFHFRF